MTMLWLSFAALSVYLAVTFSIWWRYGHLKPGVEAGSLLDRFIPRPEVVERHAIPVRAPAAVTWAAVLRVSFARSVGIRAIVRARELALGAAGAALPAGTILEQTRAMGWGLLAEVPGREVVMGAVTKPWEANVVFRPLAPADFSAFAEPEYMKIAWTLRVDPAGEGRSMARTETRVASTDDAARRTFRRYWAFIAPGVWLIRWILLRQIRRDAEGQA